MFNSASRVGRARPAAVLLLAGLLVSGCGFNAIPTDQELAKAKWSDVLNQYQRRADLIPNVNAGPIPGQRGGVKAGHWV